ncbi:MAG: patatin-like phospholipase family protein [Candidatus Hydrogenedentes bacterium]|nr:patatin-like phospholipase family protein [Candidatus Hydrogenedentota bacterium]
MGRYIRILAIDGGGIRGLLSGSLLTGLEQRLCAASGRPDARLPDFFDFFAGTSTGGILALLLLTPDPEHAGRARYSAEEVVRIYEECGATVFRSTLWRKLRSGGGFLHKKFDATGLEAAFAHHFGDTRLQDLLRPCLITAYDVERGKAHFFTQHDARNRPGYDYLVRDVARATSAAPTFFPVARIRNDRDEGLACIDGGVFANNPALCAFAEVCDKHPRTTPRDMVIFSVSTGQAPMRLAYDTVKDWGIVRWAAPLAEIMVSGASDTVDYQLRRFFDAGRCEDHYLRINPVLPEGQLPRPYIDDASPENVEALKNMGREIAKTHATHIDGLIEKLLEPEAQPRRRLAVFPRRFPWPFRAASGGG